MPYNFTFTERPIELLLWTLKIRTHPMKSLQLRDDLRCRSYRLRQQTAEIS